MTKPFMRRSGPDFIDRKGVPQSPMAFMHQCSAPGCKKWGSFGTGVSLLKNKPGKWHCEDHREK